MEKYGYGVISEGGNGCVPILWARGRNLPEGWENAMLALYDHGARVATSFDRPGDSQSRDATVIMAVDDPLAEPRIHKRAWPGGILELEGYRLEVTHGIHDHWVSRYSDKWNYTYHERLMTYEWEGNVFNQWEGLLQNLTEEAEKGKLYRRRFQVTTWIPKVDQEILDPPCLQRIHFRFLPGEDDKTWIMNVNTNWRSRDAYKASFMNIFALTELCRLFAEELSARTGLIIKMGRYMDQSDSLHVYGKDLEGVGGFDQTIEMMKSSPISDRTWRYDEMLDLFVDARREICAQMRTEQMDGSKARIDSSINVSEVVYPSEWNK